ncbi:MULTISPECIES: LysR substrate-binding domain-containing protein [Enterovibrio]|uniref:LysR substrate-binding domain-containing protein n=1 Tax=Enterovibrio TaxID=188143 RepID=UPI0013047766|nr:LysR substrate-binding domain-containing protein [Enterovibrio norvegicus]MCC4800575.1 LysR family transcriptional regulator [Enterovibrio norvegicus]
MTIVGTRSSAANFDITTLRLFVSVAEQGNIAEASRINHIAASAISKRISDLEARVGVNLLYRLRGGVEPTQAGKAMLRHAKRVLLLLEDMDAELSEFTHGMRGQVRLWANTSSITQFLPEDISRYVERFPEVGIELREETSRIIVDGVREGLTDLGIFSGHTDSGDLETRVYRHDTLMVILPTGHPLEEHETLKLEDIAAYNQVGLQDGSSLQNQLMREASSLEDPLKFRVRVLSFDGIRRMVEAGLGLAVLPEGAVIPFLEMGTFTAVKLDEPWAKRSLILGFRDYKSLPVVARTLIECLAPESS